MGDDLPPEYEDLPTADKLAYKQDLRIFGTAYIELTDDGPRHLPAEQIIREEETDA